MQIRTITAGAREADLERAGAAAQRARARLEGVGYQVQSLRLALPPLADAPASLVQYAQAIERRANAAGFDYVSLGVIDAARLADLPEAIAATQAVFASAAIAAPGGQPDPEALRAAAAAIVAIGAMTPDGFGNLRFAALGNVAPGSPFFPAAYHDGGEPWLAVGPEAAALAVEATTPSPLLRAGDDRRLTTDDRRPLRLRSGQATADDRPISSVSAMLGRLTTLIEQHDARIGAALAGLEQEHDIHFAGCDWSLAPHPDPARGIGHAIEALSGVPFGAWGTLAAVRGLTAAIRAAHVTRLGFSGVMLPVLEDEILARRNAEGRYTLRDLLAFSAVCGTGLDTIPLPGDTAPPQIATVLAEVAALASALHKPLTARLMPIPGLGAGELTRFDFPYFVNTRVMPIV